MCVTNICCDEQLFWVILWNPATRETSLQSFPLQIRREYDDSIPYSYCGFGYDHVSDTYKVMKVVEDAVLVFNMGDFDERQVGYFPPDLICLENTVVGVHFNGTLNWLVTSKINEYKIGLDTDENNIEWDNSSCMILFFDLNKEEFVRLVLLAIPYKFCDPHLGVLGECLCVSVQDKQFNFMIWQMKEFGV
ncbi:F-box/kelch-repeat protein At3g23880-like [Lotus japonicus]|uniref:F-box/kelch-repeat protein At3g23880-like n=1 Tax=Lotus japonicus TaxID=34305 RepID=UPI0025911062|nr:F-box/kelch-repeat protein At3g23880-like [Lotus japonicus]